MAERASDEDRELVLSDEDREWLRTLADRIEKMATDEDREHLRTLAEHLWKIRSEDRQRRMILVREQAEKMGGYVWSKAAHDPGETISDAILHLLAGAVGVGAPITMFDAPIEEVSSQIRPQEEASSQIRPQEEVRPGIRLQEDASTRELEIHLHGSLREMVEHLSQWQDISISDVVRKAITNEYFIQESLRRGEKLLVEKGDKKLYKVNFP